MKKKDKGLLDRLQKLSLPNIDVSLLAPKTTIGELQIIVPEELRGIAKFLIEKYITLFSFHVKYERFKSFIEGKKKYIKRTLTKPMFIAYFSLLSRFCEKNEIEKEVNEFNEFIWRYIHIRYVTLTDFLPKKVLIALIQEPPQITFPEFGQFIKPSAYINITFIPTKIKSGKIHSPVVTRFLYSNYSFYIRTRLNELLSKYPRLHSLYNQVVSRYTQQGKSEVHSRRLALRDVLRVVIGNTWLVWTYVAYNIGVIKVLDIPRFIIHDVASMINPSEIVTQKRKEQFKNETNINLDDITWKWLVETHDKTR